MGAVAIIGSSPTTQQNNSPSCQEEVRVMANLSCWLGCLAGARKMDVSIEWGCPELARQLTAGPVLGADRWQLPHDSAGLKRR